MCKLSYPNNDRELYELVSIFQKNSFSRLEEHIKMLHVDLILDIFYKNYQNPLNSTDQQRFNNRKTLWYGKEMLDRKEINIAVLMEDCANPVAYLNDPMKNRLRQFQKKTIIERLPEH